MIILFGFRRKASRLATIFVMCAACRTPAAHALTRTRRYFTLFFVPVIPLGTKYFTTCTMCGHGTQITKEGADHYLASLPQNASAPSSPPQADLAPAHTEGLPSADA
jgi:zinc-ribbon family